MADIVFKKDAASEKPKRRPLAISFNLFAKAFNWVAVALCLIVLAAGYWFLIRPKYAFVVSNQEIMQEEKQYEQKVSYLKQLNELKNIYRTVSQADKDKIDTILSGAQDADSLKIVLLREIGYVGRLNNVRVDNIQANLLDTSEGKFVSIAPDKNRVSSAALKIMSVSFTLNGVDYERLKRILGRLEKSLRLMDVTKLEFIPSTNQANIELFAYYLEH